MAPPPVRMLFIVAEVILDWHDEYRVFDEVYEVVALRTVVRHYYRSPGEHEPPDYDPVALRRDGFPLEDVETITEAVIVHPEYGLTTADDGIESSPDLAATEYVVAPWPHREDEDRLFAVRRRLADVAMKRWKEYGKK